jgi:hypothetical protein
MKTTALATAALVLTLPWSVALAKPRQGPPTPTTLSHTEQVCQAYGEFAMNRALDRNNGYPLMQVLDASRRYDRQHQAGTTVEGAHDGLIRAVFANPAVTPAQVRQLTESACLEGEGPTSASGKVQRY